MPPTTLNSEEPDNTDAAGEAVSRLAPGLKSARGTHPK